MVMGSGKHINKWLSNPILDPQNEVSWIQK